MEAATKRPAWASLIGRVVAAFCLSVAVARSGSAQAAGLVAAYGFSETTGSTTADASGNNNTGTLGTGVTRTTSGKFGGALVFNTGRVTVNNAASLTLTTAMTLEAWVNATQVSSAWRDVVYKGNDNYFIMGTTETSSRPSGGGIFGTSTGTTQAYGTTALTLNTWTHLAVTYDGTAIRLYVNGTQASSVARTGAIKTSTNPLTIGGDPIYGQYFRGSIDEVRVYNRALSAAEIQTDMNTPVDAPADNTAPTVAVTTPVTTGSYTTNTASVNIGGSSSDNVGVTQVTWSNDRGGSGIATGTTSWTVNGIALQPGANVITVTARDAANNAGTSTITATSDQTLPTIAITSPSSTGSYAATTTPIGVSGTAGDNLGLSQVSWSNNRGGSGTASGTTSWSVPAVALQSGDNIISVTARDLAGNQSTATLVATYTAPDNTSPAISISTPTSSPTYATNLASVALGGSASDNVGVTQVTWTNSAGGSGTATGTTNWGVSNVALQAGTNIITMTARDAANNTGTATVTITQDAVAPVVSITQPPSDGSVTGVVMVSANASDNVGIAGVQFFVDGSPIGGEVTNGGPDYSLSWPTTTVANGSHSLTARARDAAGNTSTSVAVVVTVLNNPATGLVAAYGFNETTGASVGDISGNNNNGSFGTGVTRTTTGRFGSALVFDGTGRVTIPNAASLTLTTGMTLEAWVSASNVSNTWRDVVYKGDDNYFLMGNTENSSAPSGGGIFGTSTGTTQAYGTTALGLNTWTHLAATYDGATLSFYMNGTLVSSVARTGNIKTSTNPLTIGGDAIYGQGFRGTIDEVRVYNRALSASEIQTDMNTPVDAPPPLDTTSPIVAVTSPTTSSTYLTNATTLALGGTSSDNVGVTQVSWSNSRGGSGTAAGTTSWSANGVALQSGVNIITITARDAANNAGTTTLTVTSDQTVPTISLTSPSGGTYATTTTPLAVNGVAGDDNGVAQVTWSNSRGGSGTAGGTTSWSVPAIALQTGVNTLTFTVRDVAGNQASANIAVTYTVPDNTAPTIGITAPTASPTYLTNGTSLNVAGTASDNVAVTQVTWTSSAGGGGTATGTTSWTVNGIVLQPGLNTITVTASDAANNTSVATLAVTLDQMLPVVAVTTPATGTYGTSSTPIAIGGTASDDNGIAQITWSNDRGGSGAATGTTNWSASAIALQQGTNVLTVTAHDLANNSATTTLSVTYAPPDTTRPTISITGPTNVSTYLTNSASLNIAGTAGDNAGVTQVTWTNSAGGSGTAAGTSSWSAGGIALQQGTNVLTVTATDAANNTATASLTVTLDQTVPTVTVTAPAAGATVSGSAVSVNASATDNNALAGVTLLVDGAPVGSEVQGVGPGFAFSWNTMGTSAGTHLLSARARDAAGNTADAPGVSVTVSNAAMGLVAAYGFEETTGSSVVDASGNGNAGTIGSGITRTTSGKLGAALVFGGGGMVTIPNAPSLSLTSSMTLEAWVNPTQISNAWRDVVYKGDDNYFLMGTTDHSSLPAAGGTFGGSSSTTESFGVAPLATNTWSHIAMTYDGASVTFFLNGTRVSSVARSGTITTSTNPLTIGGDAIYGQGFSGMIDEVRVYNRALSQAEIVADMNNPVGVIGPVDTSAPTVAITTPASPTYTATSTPLAIAGTASDNIGVTSVTWINDRGGSGAASGTTSWSVAGIGLQPGVNVITVTARDAANNAGTATLTATYNIADNSPPTIAITSPTGGATYLTSQPSLVLSGAANDNVGVTRVSWSSSTGASGDATGTTTWSVPGVSLQPGTNVITVTARDAADNVASAVLTVTQDAVVPTVTLTAPAPGATVSGSTTITASASDNGTLAGVQMLLDGAALGSEILGTGPTYDFVWSSATVSNGLHTLSARVRDAAGNTALAPNVSVTTNNAAPAGLVAAYGFEEPSGTTVLDASGNNNNGDFGSGVTRSASGRVGYALVFDGTGKVTIPNAASLNLTTAMTLEAWVNPTVVDAKWRDVVYKGNDNYFLMGSSAPNSRPAGGATIGGGATTASVGTAALAPNTWSHLAVTYDGASLLLYVNGTLVSSVAKTGSIVSSTNPLQIGGDAIFSQYFRGAIDEVRVYNRALASTEIQTDMTTPVTDPLLPPPLSATGQWSAPFSWPIVDIHAVLLKTGEVMAWEYNAAGGPFLWNPTSGSFTEVRPTTSSNMFCGGLAALPDGRILIAGGHIDAHIGTKEINIFDPSSRTWQSAPQMDVGRWYPTVTGLPDGRALIMSGESNCDGCNVLVPEVYNPLTNALTKLTGASMNFTYYPHNFVLPDGRVLTAGSAEAPVVTKVLDVGTQTWSVVDPTPVDGGSSVQYLPGKIMKTGTSHNPDLPPDPSSANTYVLDMTQPSPHWQQTQSMANPRTYHTLTVLPDGNVLVTGGAITSDPQTLSNAVLAAEMWSPATQTWTTLSSMVTARLYHSTAVLLPDGRVLVAGGGRFNGFPASGPFEHTDAEVFSPGYLFKGARPVITSAPSSADYGSAIPVQTPDGASIATVSLIHLAAVTHAFNADQRFLPLTFSTTADGLSVQMPADANLAPPGYYMLFILNADGVPSVASIIQVK